MKKYFNSSVLCFAKMGKFLPRRSPNFFSRRGIIMPQSRIIYVVQMSRAHPVISMNKILSSGLSTSAYRILTPLPISTQGNKQTNKQKFNFVEENEKIFQFVSSLLCQDGEIFAKKVSQFFQPAWHHYATKSNYLRGTNVKSTPCN